MSIELDYMEYASNAAAQENYVSNASNTLDQSQTTITSEIGYSFYASPNAQLGQTFQAGVTGYLTKCSFGLKRTGTRGGVGVYAEIYAVADSKLTGSALATSDLISFNNLSTSASLQDFVFSGANIYTLTSGNDYAIVIRMSDESYDTSNYLSAYGTASSTYANGNWCRYEGVWAYYSLYDAGFRTYMTSLNCYSENTIKTQGDYSLNVKAIATNSLNKTLTKTFDPPLDLSGKTQIKYDVRASRTGSNFKLGWHDSGGTTTEHTPNILKADVFQTETVDISSVADADKDAINSIIITQVNADSNTTYYIDNVYGTTAATVGIRSWGVIII